MHGIFKMNEQHQADESEVSMRKFLKQLGVTAHQELAKVLAEAVDSGKLSPGEKVLVKAKVELEKANKLFFLNL